jgi:hypothetical protein
LSLLHQHWFFSCKVFKSFLWLEKIQLGWWRGNGWSFLDFGWKQTNICMHPNLTKKIHKLAIILECPQEAVIESVGREHQNPWATYRFYINFCFAPLWNIHEHFDISYSCLNAYKLWCWVECEGQDAWFWHVQLTAHLCGEKCDLP